MSVYRSSDPSGWDPCGTEFPTCSPIDEGTCNFHKNIMSQDCSTQFAWFKKALTAVPADDWLIVVGHAPADEIDVEDFTSAMQSRGFDLYLNGHVHTLTQYTLDGKGAYVTSGAGAMIATEDQQDERAQTKLGGGHVHGYTTAAGVTSGHTYQSVWNNKVAGFTRHTFSTDYETLRTDYITYQAYASSARPCAPFALLNAAPHRLWQGDVVHSFTVTKGGDPRPSPPGPSPSGSCGGPGAYPCAPGCTYIHKANEASCGVSKYGCFDCEAMKSGCPDCSPQSNATLVEAA